MERKVLNDFAISNLLPQNKKEISFRCSPVWELKWELRFSFFPIPTPALVTRGISEGVRAAFQFPKQMKKAN